jgi:lysozyme
MKLGPKGAALIKEFEGLRLEAYQCPSKVWTIGYGHTGGVKEGDVITKAQAEKFFLSDILWAEEAVTKLITVPLSQNQFDALVSFTFNAGKNSLLISTLRKKLNKGQYNTVPEQLMRWVYGNGRLKLAGLVRRREAESDLWLSR